MAERSSRKSDSPASGRSTIFTMPISSHMLRTLITRIRTRDRGARQISSEKKETAGYSDVTVEEKDSSEMTKVKYLQKERISWVNETDLVIHCIGYSVGIGNVWRFPYLAFRNGGGAFLIPYLVMTIFVSFPLYYMELILGQYSRLDPISVWDFCPFFKGIGVTIMMSTIFVQAYYSVIMAWSLFYVSQTFYKVLPWAQCFKWWGANNKCYAIKLPTNGSENFLNFSSLQDASEIFEQGYLEDAASFINQNASRSNATGESAADQFWRIYVLGVSSGLGDVGTVKWELAVSLLATWIVICFLAISRHHSKISQKLKTIYFTALYPYVILGVYFIYAATLPGAKEGLKFFLLPRWKNLMNIKVWSEAAENSMYSVGLGMGGLIIFGSKNRLHYNVARCAFVAIAMDVLSSMLAAMVVFMIAGFLSDLYNLKITHTTLAGHGLVFVTIPNAAVMMGIPQLWAFLFFVMLFALATDASVAMTETIVIGLGVLFFPSNTNTKYIVLIVCIVLFLAGLTCVTNGGIYVLHILDHYAGGHSILATVMFESVAFGWGLAMAQPGKILDEIQGSKVHFFMKMCWRVIAPVTLLCLFLFTAFTSTLPPIFKEFYPEYAGIIGWCIVAAILLPVPIYMIAVFKESREDAFKLGKLWKEAVCQRGTFSV